MIIEIRKQHHLFKLTNKKTKNDKNLYISIHNNLIDDPYSYDYKVMETTNLKKFLIAEKNNEIQFSYFNQKKNDDTEIIGEGGLRFSNPVKLSNFGIMDPFNYQYKITVGGKNLIIENFKNIIKKIKNDKIISLYKNILKQMEDSFKTYNYKFDIFNYLPFMIEKNDILFWHIPNVNGGDDINIPFEGNIIILEKNIYNILSDGLKPLNNNISFTNFTEEGINSYSENCIIDNQSNTVKIIKFEHKFSNDNLYFNDGSLIYGNFTSELILENIKIENEFTTMYLPSLNKTVIDIERTIKLLEYLNLDIKIEELIEVLNTITIGEETSITENQNIKDTIYPYITKKINIDKNNVEKFDNYKLNLFSPKDSSFSKEKGFDRLFINVDIDIDKFDNPIKINTLKEEILIIDIDKLNKKDTEKNIYTPLYVPINKLNLLSEMLYEIKMVKNKNNLLKVFTYENLVFTNRQMRFDYKSLNDIKEKNISNFQILEEILSDDIEYSCVCEIYEKNKLFIFDAEKRKVFLIDLILKTNYSYENQDELPYETNISLSALSGSIIQSFFNLKDKALIFKQQLLLKDEYLNYQEIEKNFQTIEIIPNQNNEVSIPLFIQVRNEKNKIILEKNNNIPDANNFSLSLYREKCINERNNLCLVNFADGYITEVYDRTVEMENLFINGKKINIDIYNSITENINKNELLIVSVDLDKLNEYCRLQKTLKTSMIERNVSPKYHPLSSEIFIENINKIKNMNFVHPKSKEDLILKKDLTYDNFEADNLLKKEYLEKNFITSIEIPFLNLKYEGDTSIAYFSLISTVKVDKLSFSKNEDVLITEIKLSQRDEQTSNVEIVSNKSNTFVSFNTNKEIKEILKVIKKGKLDLIDKRKEDCYVLNNNSNAIILKKDLFLNKEFVLLNSHTELNKDLAHLIIDKKETLKLENNSILNNGLQFIKKDGSKSMISLDNENIEVNLVFENISMKENNDKKINFNF